MDWTLCRSQCAAQHAAAWRHRGCGRAALRRAHGQLPLPPAGRRSLLRCLAGQGRCRVPRSGTQLELSSAALQPPHRSRRRDCAPPCCRCPLRHTGAADRSAAPAASFLHPPYSPPPPRSPACKSPPRTHFRRFLSSRMSGRHSRVLWGPALGLGACSTSQWRQFPVAWRGCGLPNALPRHAGVVARVMAHSRRCRPACQASSAWGH